ncbi:MAG: hypothetical protein SFZ03_11675 [Candidatus Melainabacteria bacterium]|nr:hypothetical protein [Candidatus Melainabacteria bacterium]
MAQANARKETLTEAQKQQAQATAAELAVKNQSDWATAIKELEKRSQDPNLSIEARADLDHQLQGFRAANPWIKVYYDKAQASQLAMGFDQAIRTEWATSPVKESDNIADFDAFYDERLQKAFATVQGKYSDRAIVEDFLPAIQRSRASLLQEQINYRQKQTIEQAQQAYGSSITSKVNEFKDGLNSTVLESFNRLDKLKGLTADQKIAAFNQERDAFYQQWGTTLSQEAQTAIQLGAIGGSEANVQLAQGIIAVAEENKNTKILRLAEFVKTKDGAPLSQISKVKDMLVDARRRINSELFTEIQRQDALDKRDRDEFLRAKQTEIFDVLQDNPWADLSTYRQEFFSTDRNMGEEYMEILKVQRKLQEENLNPVPRTRESTSQVGDYVYSGGTDIKPINQAYLRGDISKDEYKDFGRTVSINRDREKRDSGLATLKKELTETAVTYAKDRYKLDIRFGINKENRIKSRNVQVETEVRRSIDSWVQQQEKGGHSPTRDDLNDYIWSRLIPRLDKQFEMSQTHQTSKPQAPKQINSQQSQQMIQQIQRSSLPPEQKKRAIQAIQKRVNANAK